MLGYRVQARRVDSHGAIAAAKTALIHIDTDPAGRADAFNPAELMLASVAAWMIKGIERVAPSVAERATPSVSYGSIMHLILSQPRLGHIDIRAPGRCRKHGRNRQNIHAHVRHAAT